MKRDTELSRHPKSTLLPPRSVQGDDDTHNVNMLSALSPTSKPVDPFDVGTNIADQVAMAAAIKVITVQNDMSKDVLRLLDPNAGTRLNVRA